MINLIVRFFVRSVGFALITAILSVVLHFLATGVQGWELFSSSGSGRFVVDYMREPWIASVFTFLFCLSFKAGRNFLAGFLSDWFTITLLTITCLMIIALLTGRSIVFW